MSVQPVAANQAGCLDAGQDRKLKKACQDFESIFLQYVMRSMRKTVEKTDLFGSSKEEDFFQDMLDTEICNAISKRETAGIADMLYRQLHQEMGRDGQAEHHQAEPGRGEDMPVERIQGNSTGESTGESTRQSTGESTRQSTGESTGETK